MAKAFRIALLVVLVIIGTPIALLAVALGYYSLFPVGSISVPLAIDSVAVSTQVWGVTNSDGSHWLTVENRHGRLVTHLWEDWGPAQQSNYYLTQEGWLAVLGSGELVALVDFRSDGPPRLLGQLERSQISPERSEGWTYLGEVNGHAPQTFSPKTSTECVQNFDQTPLRYRREHEGRFCSQQDIERLSKASAIDPR